MASVAHLRFLSLAAILQAALRFFLVLSLLLVTGIGGISLAQERAQAKGRTAAPNKEKETPVAEAVRVVADRLVAAFPRVEGLIIGVEGEQVLIDRGKADGVFQGMELNVFREGEEFKHPITGEVFGRLDKELGSLQVLQVRERYAVAAVTKTAEKAEIRQGDQVRVSMARMIVAFPNVDMDAAKGANIRPVTKDLAAALSRTGRFELIEDRQLRSMLLADKNLTSGELADPRILKQLYDKGRAQALLLGRLTPLANGFSLDVQVYSTLTGNSLVLASAEVKPTDVAHDRSSSGSQQARAGRPTEFTAGRSTELTTGSSAKPGISTARASNARPSAPAPSERFQLGPVFDQPMRALAVGDLDGDSHKELLLAAADRLIAYRIDGRQLNLLAEHRLNGKEPLAVLEVADITGDGRAKVVLTLSQKGRFHSQVLHWKDGNLVSILEAPDVVLRVLSPDGKSPQLFGQEVSPAGGAIGPIRHYTWDGRGFTPGQTLDAPGRLPLLGLSLADLSGDGGTRFLTLREGAVLEVRSQTGELVATYKDSGRLVASRSLANPRILIDTGKDGEQPQIILGREEERGVRMLRWLTRSKVASLTALRWDGTGFREVWQTPLSEGSLADYAVVDLGGELGRHLLLLVVRQGSLGFGGRSEIQAFRLR
ncbi:MAG: hypothetical protein HY278_07695 [candidate division NC10 bacterium]|nr:hypothetical protein [candidate division NC10 bacterium]